MHHLMDDATPTEPERQAFRHFGENLYRLRLGEEA
jgi:hypothetical protein